MRNVSPKSAARFPNRAQDQGAPIRRGEEGRPAKERTDSYGRIPDETHLGEPAAGRKKLTCAPNRRYPSALERSTPYDPWIESHRPEWDSRKPAVGAIRPIMLQIVGDKFFRICCPP